MLDVDLLLANEISRISVDIILYLKRFRARWMHLLMKDWNTELNQHSLSKSLVWLGLFNLTFSNLIYHFIRLLHTFTHVCTVNIYICNCTEIIIIKFLEAS